MCGRFSVSVLREVLEERFGAHMSALSYIPHYNAAPGQQLPIIKNHEPREITAATWGLVPFWVKDLSQAKPLINARSESVFAKPSFRQAALRRRCLVLADGFYEWQASPQRGKIPYRIALNTNEPFAFAGLYEEREGSSTFTIITTDANEMMAPIHNRMPVILERQAESLWLSNDAPMDELTNLLTPFPSDLMKAFAISTKVNSPAYDTPDVMAPVPK